MGVGRIKWVDAIRGLAFLMVIYSHLEYMDESLMHFFRPVFLTVFFFVSGYLYKSGQSFLYVLEQRTRTLLLPMISLGVILIVMNQLFSFNESLPFMERLKGLAFQDGHNTILWFIAALYVYSLAFYWVERWSRQSVRRLIVSIVSLFLINVACFYWLGLPKMPWHIHTIGFGVFYMGLGSIYRIYEAKADKIVSKKVLLMALAVYVTLTALISDDINYLGSRYVLDAVSVTALGLISCLYLSKYWLFRSRFLVFVGANSLFYFAFHGKVYAVLQHLAHRFVEAGNTSDFIVGMLITIADAVILILPAILVNRYMPFLLGRGFKLWRK